MRLITAFFRLGTLANTLSLALGLALCLDALINYKNNKKRELQEQGSSLSLLEPIYDASW
jgi:hypothetical protein